MKIKRNRLFPLMTAGVMTISQLMPAMTVLAADTEIVKQDDGSKVYYKNGEAQKDYTGLVNTDDAWFYVEKGVVVEDKVGYVDYEGSKFLVVNGKLADKVNGLSQDPEHTDDWYFCSNVCAVR